MPKDSTRQHKTHLRLATQSSTHNHLSGCLWILAIWICTVIITNICLIGLYFRFDGLFWSLTCTGISIYLGQFQSMVPLSTQQGCRYRCRYNFFCNWVIVHLYAQWGCRFRWGYNFVCNLLLRAGLAPNRACLDWFWDQDSLHATYFLTLQEFHYAPRAPYPVCSILIPRTPWHLWQ